MDLELRQLRHALAATPTDLALALKLAHALEREGAPEEALAVLATAVERHPRESLPLESAALLVARSPRETARALEAARGRALERMLALVVATGELAPVVAVACEPRQRPGLVREAYLALARTHTTDMPWLCELAPGDLEEGRLPPLPVAHQMHQGTLPSLGSRWSWRGYNEVPVASWLFRKEQLARVALETYDPALLPWLLELARGGADQGPDERARRAFRLLSGVDAPPLCPLMLTQRREHLERRRNPRPVAWIMAREAVTPFDRPRGPS